jgi:hypothetical protein
MYKNIRVVSGPITPLPCALVRLSNITALLPPSLPHPELIRNQQETVRCIKERYGT